MFRRTRPALQNENTALIKSASGGHIDVVKLLLDKTADVNEANKVPSTLPT